MTNITCLTYTDKNYPATILCGSCIKPLLYPVFCQICGYYTCRSCLMDDCCCDTPISSTNVPINGYGELCEILNTLRVYCPINKSNGCQWIGNRSEIMGHVIECENIYLKYEML